VEHHASPVTSSLLLKLWKRPAYALHRDEAALQKKGFWSDVGEAVHRTTASYSKSRYERVEEEIPLAESIKEHV
jgi:hypothetical protein